VIGEAAARARRGRMARWDNIVVVFVCVMMVVSQRCSTMNERRAREWVRKEMRGERDEVEFQDLGSQVCIYPSETGFAAISTIRSRQSSESGGITPVSRP
jgi:hypothetical protein